MTNIEFFRIISIEPREVVINVLRRQDIFTLQRLKRKFRMYGVSNDIIDAINHKLSGM